MLIRKAYKKLSEWKNCKDKKALCIIGARQIGKTTLVREFADKNYGHYIEINFITDPGAAEIFSGSLDADTLITNITAYTRKETAPGDTLILFGKFRSGRNHRVPEKML